VAQMTDPLAALTSFQEVFETEGIPLQRGVIDPTLFVHRDEPTGSPRFTYVRLDRRTVTALVMFAQVQPLKGLLCFQLGVAVPEKYRAQGRAKEIVIAATAELQNGLSRSGIPAFYVEAVVGTVARQSGWWSATIRMTFGNRDEVIMFALIVAGKR
jgi:hypothetical protein